ncbi:MAG TPA: amidohydrolase family protein [Bryobacteraceae bacterium]|jgi:imidazolonepropionase-like amidohydrolase|nr:amidohydrolase family protein [Bryobacteraceae bacterium]
MKRLGLLIAFGVAACAAANDTFLIRGVDVYPVTGPEVKGISVLVQDGKIADIGAKIVAPKGMKIVEGKGLRLYPGMIDSNTELGLSEVGAERVTVDTGELGEFMPQLKALSAVNPESAHFPVVRANGITSVMTFPAAGGRGGRGGGGAQFISGQAALIHMDGWTWEDMEINRSAAVHLLFPSIASRGGRGGLANVDFADEIALLFGGGSAAGTYTEAKRNYDAQVAKVTEFFEQARQYQKERTANLPGFKRDLKFEAMLPVLEGKVPVAVPAARERAIHDAIAFAEKEHIKIVILAPQELGKEGPELKAKNIPVILGRTEALPENQDAPYDYAESLPGEFYKAGVKIAFGTFDNEFSRNLPYNAARAVAYGLPYDAALKAITINAAEIWGAGDKMGSIEKGKWADLMLVTGDPLETPTQIKSLYIKGKEVDLSNKQTKLYDKYLARP